MAGLDVEQGCHLRQQRLPLVEPQAIHDHEQHPAVLAEHRQHHFLDDVLRQRRPVRVRLRDPTRILAGDEGPEVPPQRDQQRLQSLS